MATLYERITGVGLAAESGDRIPIHAFIGAVFEQQRGKFTAQEVIDAFALDAGQVTDATTFIGLLNAAPDKLDFMRVFKDALYLAETGYGYQTGAAMLTRLQEAVTDQGGTLP